MTTVAGFTCFDGVLMMADTEETTSIYTKSDCDKMHYFRFPSGTVLMGGAGNAHLIECAFQELEKFLATEGKSIENAQQFLDKLNEFAQNFYYETTGQYGAEFPAIMLAVNLHVKRTFLFHWEDNRARWVPSPSHDAIGTGTVQLHPMLRDFQFTPTRETALFCGIRMMLHAKKIVQGVGGKTEAIALLNDGKVMYYGTDNTQKIEQLVDNFEQCLNKFVYTSLSIISPEIAGVEENFEKNIAHVPDELRHVREAYKKLLPEHNIDASVASTATGAATSHTTSQTAKRRSSKPKKGNF
jgi:TATA-box binding protein (TBP) (component of TFIID and TFIIIB)